MKKIITILITVTTCFSSYAQDPQLFENTWYLQNVIVNGNNNFPPSNSEVEFVPAIFTEPNSLSTTVCNTFDTVLDFSNPDEFTITSYSLTLIFCNLQVNSDFEGIYFDFFFDQATQDPYTDPFPYDIVVNGSQKTLTITNVNGGMAIYGNELLSTQDYSKNLFTIFPNPVKNDLFVSGTIDLNDVKINIFDINGKLVLSLNGFDANNKSIDLQELGSGIYFILLENKQGRSAMKKFIKT